MSSPTGNSCRHADEAEREIGHLTLLTRDLEDGYEADLAVEDRP